LLEQAIVAATEDTFQYTGNHIFIFSTANNRG
jgi:hypothetical protein